MKYHFASFLSEAWFLRVFGIYLWTSESDKWAKLILSKRSFFCYQERAHLNMLVFITIENRQCLHPIIKRLIFFKGPSFASYKFNQGIIHWPCNMVLPFPFSSTFLKWFLDSAFALCFCLTWSLLWWSVSNIKLRWLLCKNILRPTPLPHETVSNTRKASSFKVFISCFSATLMILEHLCFIYHVRVIITSEPWPPFN